jgi:putative transferase (TIGR04331 family)
MKVNFVVSAFRDIWLPSTKNLFAVDPYIAHVLEKEGRISDYDEIKVAAVSRSTREEFSRDHDFVDHKFRRYSEVLAHRLDEIHGTSHGEAFWQKALSLAILRHVTFCYDLFKVCETYLDPTQHDCRVLDPGSFILPEDFDEHRQIFQHTDLGQEQLFSVYCGLFHSGRFPTWKESKPAATQIFVPPSPQPMSFLQKLAPRWIAQAFSSPRQFMHRVVAWGLRIRSPRLAIINCSFSPENTHRLLVESLGRIRTVPLPNVLPSTSVPDWNLRDRLVREQPDFDRFDKFAFACLRHGIPKMFVEDFPQVYAQLDLYFNRYPDLRWVVCEWWIGHTFSALATAVLQQRGVRHIYNEHNYLAHPFLGNNLKYLQPLVNEYVTVGWKDPTIPNFLSGASLFPWVEGDDSGKEHDLLFISSIPNTRVPEINACYGESGARVVPGYLEMNLLFFQTLDESTLCTMVYRAYPESAARQALAWGQEYVLQKFLNRVKLIDDSDISARLLMQRSRLTVVNYLSTSYLEALLADVPTIILWNERAYLLEDRDKGFFEGLVAARICHTDPAEAARFVEQIKNDPEAWWLSPSVRRARAEFLQTNIGSPDVLVKHLLDRARGSRDAATPQDSK